MVAEESETPADGPRQRSERDLLAERRARRAAEAGDIGLLRRAEAAEATVKTLETHLASLQQRLLETEESARRSAERLAERELQLRRVKQQEYAEQQLRIEAEQALEDANRRIAEIDGHGRALGELQQRVAELERRSIKLERAFDDERRARERGEQALEQMRRSHTAIAATLGELRALAASLRALAERGPAGELPAASSTPAPLPAASSETVPSSAHPHARVGAPPPQPAGGSSMSGVPASPVPASSEARREELAEALAVAVERLRARAETEASRAAHEQETASASSSTSPAPSSTSPGPSSTSPGPSSTSSASSSTSPAQAVAAGAAAQATAPSARVEGDVPLTTAHAAVPDAPAPPTGASSSRARPRAKWPLTHKHSMSLIGRWRAARKHRRQRRQEERRAG